MNSKRMTRRSTRIVIGGLVALLAYSTLVTVSPNFATWLHGHFESAHGQSDPTLSRNAVAIKPARTPVAGSPQPLANLPPARDLKAEAERMLALFDQGRMHELYALFTDEAKAQVPESVFVEQANEVLQQLGPIKPDGWNDAHFISTFLNGRSHGRKVVLWKLNPETQQFYVGSWRFGELSESTEDVWLDVSSTPIRLAMISEFKAQAPAASVWLPRTCSHPGEDPLRHCKNPDDP